MAGNYVSALMMDPDTFASPATVRTRQPAVVMGRRQELREYCTSAASCAESVSVFRGVENASSPTPKLVCAQSELKEGWRPKPPSPGVVNDVGNGVGGASAAAGPGTAKREAQDHGQPGAAGAGAASTREAEEECVSRLTAPQQPLPPTRLVRLPFAFDSQSHFFFSPSSLNSPLLYLLFSLLPPSHSSFPR